MTSGSHDSASFQAQYFDPATAQRPQCAAQAVRLAHPQCRSTVTESKPAATAPTHRAAARRRRARFGCPSPRHFGSSAASKPRGHWVARVCCAPRAGAGGKRGVREEVAGALTPFSSPFATQKSRRSVWFLRLQQFVSASAAAPDHFAQRSKRCSAAFAQRRDAPSRASARPRATRPHRLCLVHRHCHCLG